MMWRPPKSTRTDTRFPYTTLYRSAGHNELSLLPSGEGGRLSQMRISRNRRLQSPLVAAVAAIPVRMIASHPFGIGAADVGECRLRGEAKHLQRLLIVGRKHLPVARDRPFGQIGRAHV